MREQVPSQVKLRKEEGSQKLGTAAVKMAVEEPQSSHPPPLEGSASSTEKGSGETTVERASRKRPEREPSLKDYFRIFSYATKWDIVIYFFASVASVGAGTTLPLMNIVFGSLAGQFTTYFMNPPRMTRTEFEVLLDQLALYILGLFLCRFVLNCINKFCFRMIGVRLSSAVRLHYIQSLFGQSIHVLDSMPSGSAASTITGAANTLQIGISEKLGTFMEFNGTIWCAIVVSFVWSWKLTLVTFSIVIFILIVVSVFLPFIVRLQDQQSKSEAKANGVASESFSSIRMLTACGAQKTMSARYARWVDDARAKGQRSAPLLALQFALVFFGTYAVFGLSFWFGTKQFADGEMTNPGTTIIVLMSVMMIVMSVERIANPLMAVSRAMVAACEFFAVIDAPRPDTGSLKDPDVVATDDIVFEDVTFAYPSRPHVKILDNLSLTIEAGKNTAIVGPSGSGKSTIVGLVERWYDLREQYVIEKTLGVEKINGTAQDKTEKKKEEEKKNKDKNNSKKGQEGDSIELVQNQQDPGADEESQPVVPLSGSITTGGKALTDIDLKWWRSQIGLVQQEPFLFNDTIFRNVAYGLIGSAFEDASEEEKRRLVREACHEAFADEFIDRLPDGYDTPVGDGGAKLSGGQRQRIAIARSIVRKPKIIILDEATSAIDVRGEKIVQAALDRVARDRTTITIAHRLSTIRKADKIVVLRKGQVVESGTHDSLVENQSGAYYGLVHAQRLSLGQQQQPAEDDDVTSGEDLLDQEVAAAKTRSAQVSVNLQEMQQARSKEPNVFRSFLGLLAEQKNRWVYLAIAFFAACSAAGTPLMAWLFAQVFQVFTFVNVDTIRSQGQFWSLMWVVLAVGIGVGYFFQGAIAVHMQHNISAIYKKEYFESILYQKTAFFDEEENSHGTLVARVAGDPKQLEELLGLNMAFLLMAVFNIVGALSIAFAFGWKLALLATFVTMPIGLFAGYWKFKYELEFEKMNAAVFAESSRFAAEAIGAFRTVSSLTMENVIHSRYDKLLRSHVLQAYKKARWTSLLFGLADSVNLGCQGLIFWYGGRRLASREYNLIDFFVCFMAVVQGAEAAGQGLSYGPNAAQASAAANRIISLRDPSRKDNNNKNSNATEQQIPDAEGGIKIELKNAHFRYPSRDTPVFTGIDLTIEKGQFAALVGPSGCGKTSIISLLERFYHLNKGDILCNGKSIYSLDANEYRKNMSLVAQEPCMFQGTIRENICLGVDADTISDARLHQICRDASIHDFIVSLPEGYNTDIGSKGFSLSGGQKQRISIARALIRDPKILLLDEATSSLDSESEKLVQAAFERASKGRTMICVAHRLATVQNADIIFVFGEGKVIEKGTHQELLKMQGVYWQMCQSQALDR